MMIPFRIILVFCITCLGLVNSHAQSDSIKKQAYEYAKEGMQLVQKDRLDQAIDAYKKGQELDPENLLFQYEIAVVYYLKKEYAQTISLLEKVIDKRNANDQFYQILGNAYDLSGQSGKARKTYQAGMKRFPSSGVLYLEAGILEYMHKNSYDARRYWESGVTAQPAFALNYYWLAKSYASTTEKVWAVLYGEVFINMDRNSEKTQEISQLLYDVYRNSLPQNMADSGAVSFTKSIAGQSIKGILLPFEQVFQNTMQQAADSLFAGGADSMGYYEICRVRELFLHFWTLNNLDESYPNILFDNHKTMSEKGFMECYQRWVFLKSNEASFQSWYYTHTDLYTSFVKWFAKNPLKVNGEHYFSRSLY